MVLYLLSKILCRFKCLYHLTHVFSELNDNLAGDAIEGEIPALLRAVLAQDPAVFKGRNAYNATNNTGNIHLFITYIFYNNITVLLTYICTLFYL